MGQSFRGCDDAGSTQPPGGFGVHQQLGASGLFLALVFVLASQYHALRLRGWRGRHLRLPACFHGFLHSAQLRVLRRRAAL